MKQKNDLQLHDDYFVLHLSGPAIPPDEILNSMKRVIQFCKDNSIRKGIIYRSESVKQNATILDFYNLSVFLATQKLSWGRFALVFPKESGEDEIDFFETSSVN